MREYIIIHPIHQIFHQSFPLRPITAVAWFISVLLFLTNKTGWFELFQVFNQRSLKNHCENESSEER